MNAHHHARPRSNMGRNLTQVRDEINDVDLSLDALCELLHKANGELVSSGNLLQLLQPLRNKLCQACEDLNDRLL